MLVLLGVAVFVDGSFGLVDTRVDHGVEAELQVAGYVVSEVEVPVPIELLGHAYGNLVVGICDVAFLHLLIVAVELPTVAELRGCGVERQVLD